MRYVSKVDEGEQILGAVCTICGNAVRLDMLILFELEDDIEDEE
jgi:hypothetical protein